MQLMSLSGFQISDSDFKDDRRLSHATGGRRVDVTSSDIPREVLDVVEQLGRNKWRELGVALEFRDDELYEYDDSPLYRTLQSKAHQVIYNWQRREGEAATVAKLLDACHKVQVKEGVVKQARNEYGIYFS